MQRPSRCLISLLLLMLHFEHYKTAFKKRLLQYSLSICLKETVSLEFLWGKNKTERSYICCWYIKVKYLNYGLKRKFEICYPWGNRNATSVLQRRKPGQIEKQKKKQKTKQSNHMESSFYCPIKSSLSRKCFLLQLPPKKNKQKKTKKENITKQNIRVKNYNNKNSKKKRF